MVRKQGEELSLSDHMLPAHRKRLRFRELLARPGLTVMPGGFSPMYAKTAQLAGFETFFVAGSQMSAFLLGVPDNGVIGLRDMADHARHVASRSDIPILLDCDTGFGNAVNVFFTVQEIINSGVAALTLEDQEAPKKSGTSAGRRCISAAEMIGKLRAAADARDAIDPAFSIVARCDLIGAEGSSFEQALERCVAYATEGRADVVFINSVETLDQLARVCKAVPVPVLMIWGGAPPGPSFEDIEKTGCKVALYPVMAATAGLQAAWHLLNDFRVRGVSAISDWRKQVESSPYGAINFSELTGYSGVRAMETKYMPADAQRDYDNTWGHKTHLGREDGREK
jgi:2-methylisocitrate lyase-like PEP mutase family enzyme